MVRARHRSQVLAARDPLQDPLGYHGMLANERELRLGQPRRLIEDPIGYRELADVVQERSAPEVRSVAASAPTSVARLITMTQARSE